MDDLKFQIDPLNMVRLVIIALGLSIGNMAAFAQGQQFKFKHLDISNGLSSHQITSFLKDRNGFIWIGTTFGLNRFDGYTVKPFLHDARDTTTLIDNSIRRLFESPDGRIGVLTASGLALYNPENDQFERHLDRFYAKYGTSDQLINIVASGNGQYWFVERFRLINYLAADDKIIVIQNVEGDSTSIERETISDVSIDRNGAAWIVYSNGVVEKVELTNGRGRVVKRIRVAYDFNNDQPVQYQILSDTDGDIWICAPTLFQGVFYYDVRANLLHHLTTTSGYLRLNANAVSGFIEANDGMIWIGTDHGGINVVDKKNSSVRYITHRDGDNSSLSENSVQAFYKDDQDIVWAGTYKRGVNYYHEDLHQFDVYKHNSLDPTSLPFEDINRFAEDDRGNLWIGTNGGGLLYFDRHTGQFRQYKHEPGNGNSICGNVIVSLCFDSEKNLWIGTYKNGLCKFDGEKFVTFKRMAGDTLSLPSENVWEVFEDSKKRLWIGTLDAGAALLDRKSGKFQRLKIGGDNAIQSGTIDAIVEDRHGNLWFGTTNGIDVMSPDGKTFTHFKSSSDPHSLSNNIVLDIREDSKGRMWIGTMDGLNLYNDTIKGFRVYKKSLPHNAVLAIQEDKIGKLWMSTLNGLCEMSPQNDGLEEESFRHYTETDGLQGLQFNLNAAFKTRRGDLLFGGPTGFNVYRANYNGEDLSATKIVFSDLELYGKSVRIGEKVEGVVVLKKSISQLPEIVLPANKNFFTIKFSDLNYFNPKKSQYSYKLEGSTTGWLPVDTKSHEIVFSGLNPGQYTLRVKAANGNADDDKAAALSITILPPFWKTKTAFAIYAFILVGILIIARRLIQQREKLKFRLEQQRQEAQRMHELDMMKVKFFTNVSHEFRTPLTLILTPIARLIKKTTDPDQLNQFQLIHRNGKRLMNLVNQLLDFKKLEVQEIKLNTSSGDIVGFVKDIVLSFSDLSEKKNIKLIFQASHEHLETYFDQDKLEKILFNLLSNAFKFTLDNGVVTVKLELTANNGGQVLSIEVIDTGIGIPEDKLERIFEPFFQNDLPRNIVNQGSGIGLAITKEFVRIHGGNIAVTSELGKGSCFRITMPLLPAHADVETIVNTSKPESAIVAEDLDAPTGTTGAPSAEANKRSLLLIEDNDDFRFYLKDNLKFLYIIHEAKNGAEGWNQILSIQPDLIISDVMMPEMDGIELCAKVKSDERVSHIPVILLTSRSSEEQRIEGFKTGADDYITKPFNFEVLEARIFNLLKRQEKSQKNFRKTLDIKASELEITPLDVKFVENAIKCVEKHVSSADFSVEDLGIELGISRAYVFKKIQALTGKTPLEFIRNIRLQHAAQLLEKSQLSVSEVAYKVGFNNPKYFTRYFKEHFHVLPSQYVLQKRKARGDN